VHISRMKNLVAAAASVAMALALSACGVASDTAGNASTGAQGDPVAGGSLRFIAAGEPRNLDPGKLSNTWAINAPVGAALYGALLHVDATTGEVTPHMAESWTTEDNGKTFTLKLREGIEFTDGTPYDAEAVKFNWERMKDPSVSPSSVSIAGMIESTKVVDPLTLQVTLAEPNPKFGVAVATYALNWVGSPTALKGDPAAFDANPVGAGPFKLVKWTPNDVMELEKNESYFEGPDKPYLDKLTIRTVTDSNQRYNTLVSDGADVIIETNPGVGKKLEDAGKTVNGVTLGGGLYLCLNTEKAPFDDPRARQALAAAIDTAALTDAYSQGNGTVPKTLFPEDSPFYADKPLDAHDPEKAQALFDELADEGKPVKFTFTGYGTFETTAAGESLITQLDAYENVEVDMVNVELADVGRVTVGGEFQAIVSTVLFSGDPEPRISMVFRSGHPSNTSRISEPELDAALEAGRLGKTEEERKEAYDKVQDLFIELRPGILFGTQTPMLIGAERVGGLGQYGLGTPKLEDFWIQK
jgi:peptide/nickel transport system substrate-binding protein